MEILGQLHFRRINNELKCQIILWKHPVTQMPLKGKKKVMLRNNRKICLWWVLRNYITGYNRFLPSSTSMKTCAFSRLQCTFSLNKGSYLTVAGKVLMSILYGQAFLPKVAKLILPYFSHQNSQSRTVV